MDLRPQGGIRHGLLEWVGDGGASSGALVLFLHANSLCAGVWSPIVHRLPGSVSAVACDLRSHGNSDAPIDSKAYHWQSIGGDVRRIVASVAQRYGRAVDLCVTHSFIGDCTLMSLIDEGPLELGRLLLLDPVLADAEGASTGAKRLAEGTRRLGQKEAEGFDSSEAVQASLERLLRGALFNGTLHTEAKAAFAEYGAAQDASGRWRLKNSRDHEAEVYANRVALADHLEALAAGGRRADVESHLVFARKRRGRPEDQEKLFERDWQEASRVIACCRDGSSLQLLEDVGHFLVLENPDLVADTVRRFL